MRIEGVDPGSIIPLQSIPKADLSGGEARGGKNNRLDSLNGGKAEDGNTQVQIRDQDLKDAVKQFNQTMETYHTEIRFQLHEKSGEMMVKVINSRDGTVIREIPPEKILNMIAYMKKTLGILIDKFI